MTVAVAKSYRRRDRQNTRPRVMRGSGLSRRLAFYRTSRLCRIAAARLLRSGQPPTSATASKPST